ncbi:MAG TPA: aminomethyl-transferring glycine dehydrogenase subunit GcvPA, partial [Nitriliruptorales bacterium]|nr:aminomethyl-transferring glycine dehydrogenase subunit GcvPA [Nitriliruptorales bacterium]
RGSRALRRRCPRGLGRVDADRLTSFDHRGGMWKDAVPSRPDEERPVQFAPHTDADVHHMLDMLGLGSLDELFDHIPDSVRVGDTIDLPDGLAEEEVVRHLQALAARNRGADLVCFAGGGAYDHYVPALIPAILSRGELYTSYTPYQPEVSQGVLQALFEYQTVICQLTGLDVSNASLYDGASAAAEAVNMALAATDRQGVVVSGGLAPGTREVVRTFAHPRTLDVTEAPLDDDGRTHVPRLGEGTGAYLLSQPNHLGVVEDVRAHARAAHAVGARLVVSFDATAAGLLARPGDQDADLVVGDGLQLGNALQFGGPSFGFLAARLKEVRGLPGRLVGETVDARGHRGFVLTLQAREQHIRREKATSNICTNQTLNALAGLLYLVWLGPDGLRELASTCLQRAHDLARRLAAVDGVHLAVTAPFFKEFPLRVPGDPDAFVAAVAEEGYLVGPVVRDGPAAGAVLVAATERRTAAEADGLTQAVARAAKEAGA